MTREEAIEIIEIAKAETEWDYPLDYQIAFDEAIEALKQSEQKHGKWIEDSDGDGRYCSKCGKDHCYIVSDCEKYNFCPNCGAKMDL